MRILGIMALALLLAMPAQAAFVAGGQEAGGQGAGGFAGPGASRPTTVKAAQNMKDDTPVTLTGKIISQTGKDKYVFQDATGQITVEIDAEDFRGQTVTPDTIIRISGEVDKDWNRPAEIDVKRLDVID